MEPECSSPKSQQPTTCPYPQPPKSGPATPYHFFKGILILILHSHLGLPNVIYPQVSPPKSCMQLPSTTTLNSTHRAILTKITNKLQCLCPGPWSRCETQAYRIQSSLMSRDLAPITQSTLNMRFSFRLPKPRGEIGLGKHTLQDQC
jgi:hypothetical protein